MRACLMIKEKCKKMPDTGYWLLREIALLSGGKFSVKHMLCHPVKAGFFIKKIMEKQEGPG